MAQQPWHEHLYTIGLWASYIFLTLTWLGVYIINPKYMELLDKALSIYVAVFLVYNFNPFTKRPVSQFGRGIAFSAGIFLLSSSIIRIFPGLKQFLGGDRSEYDMKLIELGSRV